MPSQQRVPVTRDRQTRQSQMQNILREFVFIFFDRLGIIVPVFLAVFLTTAIIALLLPPVYKSSTKFSLAIPQTLDPLQKETYYDYQNKVKRYLDDQKELIFSNRVLEKVVRMKFENRPEEDYPEIINKIHKKLAVTPPRGETFEGSNVFYLTFQDKDPRRAQQFASAITQAYLETYSEITKRRTGYSHDFFDEQTRELYQKMMAKEKDLRDYEKKQAESLLEMLNLEKGAGANQEVGPNALLTRFVGRYHDLQEQLAGLQNAIGAVEQELEDKQIPVVMPDMEVSGRALSVFKNKVAQLQIQLNEMRPQFNEQFELYKQVEAELNLNIESLRRELGRTVRAKKIAATSIEAEIQEVENVIQYLRDRIKAVAEERSVYQHLNQEYTIAKDAYVGSRSKLEQARLALSLNQERQYLTLVDEPVVPPKPFKPNRPLLIALGLFAGLFLGIAIALTIDHFDHSMKRLEDIDSYMETPVLGSMPKVQ